MAVKKKAKKEQNQCLYDRGTGKSESRRNYTI
jgi:hypothetical protein